MVNGRCGCGVVQVIRDLASRGILINRALLTSPPPAYNELMINPLGYRRRPTTCMATMAISDRGGPETTSVEGTYNSNVTTGYHGNSNCSDVIWKSPSQQTRSQMSPLDLN